MNQVRDFSANDWLNYLEKRHHEKIQLGLSRVHAVAKSLSLLHPKATVITVAGTNGKGSTIAALEAIYHEAGYRVAAYTSPHLLRFNERIRIDKTPIKDSALIQAFLAIHDTPGSHLLTYFEMATLAALWHFKHNQPDVILLEVGMGGRLDATNCIDADLSIVTTIDIDHEAFLGNTKEAIAIEKAGVFRPLQLSVYADENPPHSLLKAAKASQLDLAILNRDYTFSVSDDTFIFSNTHSFSLTLTCPSIHPKAFAAAVMASLKLNTTLPVSQAHYAAAATHATILGRKQWLNNNAIPTLVDVAHNKQAVNLLAEFIKKNPPTGNIHAVFSGLQDKTLYDLIAPMRAYVNTWYLTTLNHTRSATKASLKDAYTHVMNKQPDAVFDEPSSAFAAAANAVKPGDVILVYGSFLLVSAVMLAHFQEGEDNELCN
ncbi:MAG: Mur ligase family protein [Legionellaceae bacterium]|nr:Mur ligase family protein [Legionellaceae bacterium]